MAEIQPDPNNTNDDPTQGAVAKRFWRAVDRIQSRNDDKAPDEELERISRIVDDARQERYDAAKRIPKSSR